MNLDHVRLHRPRVRTLAFGVAALLFGCGKQPTDAPSGGAQATIDLPPEPVAKEVKAPPAEAPLVAEAVGNAAEPKPVAKPPAPPAPAKPAAKPPAKPEKEADTSTEPPPAAATPAPPEEAEADAPQAAASTRPPLPLPVIASTIRKIGYPCDSVKSVTSASDGAYKIVCASGATYRGTRNDGHLRFRQWHGD